MIDIRQTESGDIDLSTGDIQWCSTEEATGQHKRDILVSAPGDYRESPTTGVGTINYLNDDSGLFFRDVAIQMQADGIKVKSVSFDDNGELEIIGGYEPDNS